MSHGILKLCVSKFQPRSPWRHFPNLLFLRGIIPVDCTTTHSITQTQIPNVTWGNPTLYVWLITKSCNVYYPIELFILFSLARLTPLFTRAFEMALRLSTFHHAECSAYLPWHSRIQNWPHPDTTITIHKRKNWSIELHQDLKLLLWKRFS